MERKEGRKGSSFLMGQNTLAFHGGKGFLLVSTMVDPVRGSVCVLYTVHINGFV